MLLASPPVDYVTARKPLSKKYKLLTTIKLSNYGRKKIRAKFSARKLENQNEFDRMMSEMNREQTLLNHPYLDRDRELAKQRSMLETQRNAIQIQIKQNQMERIELEQKRKDINRLFHELKHELIQLNPMDGWPKKEDVSNGD